MPVCIFGAGILLACLGGGAARADGTLRTGGTEPVIVLSESLGLAVGSDLRVMFTLEFATEEVPSAGAFLDAATVVVSRGGDAATLVTIDGFGVRLVPPSPSGWVVDPASLKDGPGAFAAPLDFVAAGRWSRDMEFVLPREWAGGPVQFSLELFDNGNGQSSLAAVRNVRLVPEAGTIGMLGVGLALLLVGGGVAGRKS